MVISIFLKIQISQNELANKRIVLGQFFIDIIVDFSRDILSVLVN